MIPVVRDDILLIKYEHSFSHLYSCPLIEWRDFRHQFYILTCLITIHLKAKLSAPQGEFEAI